MFILHALQMLLVVLGHITKEQQVREEWSGWVWLNSLESLDAFGIPLSFLRKRGVVLPCEVFISGCRRTLGRGNTVRNERRLSFKRDDGTVTFTLMRVIFIWLEPVRQFRVSACQAFQH